LNQPIEPLDFSAITTYPLAQRKNKVNREGFGRPHRPGDSVHTFLEKLPGFLAAADLLALAGQVAQAHRRGRMVLLMMGAHVIKVGLGPIILDLLDRGIVNALALNGAGAVHDVELALIGETSEDVGAGIREARFGLVTETGRFINQAARQAANDHTGLGAAVGAKLLQDAPPHLVLSLLARAAQLNLPATLHVTIGADIHHIHPGTSGHELGEASFNDLRLLAGVIARLGDGGVVINIGSAVNLPVVFEKALTAARSLGHPVEGFVGANLDFIQHYRGRLNPVQRARELGGTGYSITGHHELTVTLLAAAILEALEPEA